jgi:hypothetical protein
MLICNLFIYVICRHDFAQLNCCILNFLQFDVNKKIAIENGCYDIKFSQVNMKFNFYSMLKTLGF